MDAKTERYGVREQGTTLHSGELSKGEKNSLKGMKKRHSKYYLAGSVSLISFLVYLPSLRNDFVWDDMAYIVENFHIRSLDMTMVKWAFSHFSVANWHPLSWMSHALDYALWGLNPLGHHLTNVILHTLNTIVTTFLAMHLIKGTSPLSAQDRSTPFQNDTAVLIAGGVTGLLFGLHPLHAESAAWVAERKDLLCALFYLLSIRAYSAYARIRETVPRDSLPSPSLRYYLASVGLFVLALLSKPMAVSLPVVLLILDWYPFRRIHSKTMFLTALFEKLPFVALSLVSSLITIMAQEAGGTLQSLDTIPLSSRLIVAAESLIAYLWRMVFPLNLMPYYPYNENLSVLSPASIGAAVLVLGITLACVAVARKHGLWISAWSYYVITLAPTLGIIQVGSQASADRYTYLPSLAPFLLAGLAAAALFAQSTTPSRRSPLLGFAGVAVLLFGLLSIIYLTSKQILIRKDNITLFTSVIEREPRRVPFAYYNRGTAFLNKGDISKAIEDLNIAIDLDPNYYQAYCNRGMAYAHAGKLDKAIEDFDRSITLEPSYFRPYFNRGIAFFSTGNSTKAIEDLSKAITLNPYYYQSYYNRGTAYGKTGDFGRAIEDFDRTLRLNPSYEPARFNRKIALDELRHHNNLPGYRK